MEEDDSIAVIGIGCNFPGGKPIGFENLVLFIVFLNVSVFSLCLIK